MIALIPAWNDWYTLFFSLLSLVEHFDRVIVYDDASIDDTPAVGFEFQKRFDNVTLVVNTGSPVGWIEARNRLLAMAVGERDLFFLDSDDILCPFAHEELSTICAIGKPTYLRLFGLWGDWDHGTQYGCHLDPCHLYVPRPDGIEWKGSTPDGHSARPSLSGPARKTHTTLLLHAKGVKPDYRIFLRHHIKPWIQAGRPCPLPEWCDLIHRRPDELHHEATHILLNASNRALPTYCEPRDRDVPERPLFIEREARDPMFRFLYEGKDIVDREVADRDYSYYVEKFL